MKRRRSLTITLLLFAFLLIPGIAQGSTLISVNPSFYYTELYADVSPDSPTGGLLRFNGTVTCEDVIVQTQDHYINLSANVPLGSQSLTPKQHIFNGTMGSMDFQLDVVVPLGTPFGSDFPVELVAYCHDSIGYGSSSTSSAMVRIDPYQGLLVEPANIQRTIQQGQTVTLEFAVRNQGNVQDEFDVTPLDVISHSAAGWTMPSAQSFTLDHQGIKTLTMSLTAGQDTPVGEHIILINVTSKNSPVGLYHHQTIKLTVTSDGEDSVPSGFSQLRDKGADLLLDILPYVIVSITLAIVVLLGVATYGASRKGAGIFKKGSKEPEEPFKNGSNIDGSGRPMEDDPYSSSSNGTNLEEDHGLNGGIGSDMAQTDIDTGENAPNMPGSPDNIIEYIIEETELPIPDAEGAMGLGNRQNGLVPEQVDTSEGSTDKGNNVMSAGALEESTGKITLVCNKCGNEVKLMSASGISRVFCSECGSPIHIS